MRDARTLSTVFEVKEEIPVHLLCSTLIRGRRIPYSKRTRSLLFAIRFLPVVAATVLTLGAGQSADRVAAIHREVVFVDMHAHPSTFHRANVSQVQPDELARYRRALMDVVVCDISTDAVFSGGYVTRNGTEVKRGEHPRPKPGEPFSFTVDRFARITQTTEGGDAVLAISPEQVLEAKRQGKLALLAALEGGDGLEARIENLRELHRRGLRLLQLVHLRANELGHIQTYPYSPGGLTPFGREAVREANRLGIIIDLAHANTETIMDALKESSQPVLFSHTGVKALHDGDRNLTDDEIVAIASKGGIIGIWPNGELIPTMDDMVRNIDYVKKLVGIDHIGIGSDLRGLGSYTSGFGEDANFQAIAEALLAHGYSEEEVGKVMGGNFMRVWRQISAQAQR
jgi:membrane dipeptidase